MKGKGALLSLPVAILLHRGEMKDLFSVQPLLLIWKPYGGNAGWKSYVPIFSKAYSA
jgi:hypothetical protein